MCTSHTFEPCNTNDKMSSFKIPPPSSSLRCMFCDGIVSFEDRDSTKFFKHLQTHHEIHFKFELILTINLMDSDVIDDIIAK